MVGGTDNGRQKTRNHGYDVIVGGGAFAGQHSQACHAKPKTQINRRRTLPASFPLVGCLPQAAAENFSPKSQDAVALQQIKAWRFTLIDRGDIRQAIDRCSNIWASLPGAGYGQFEHKADSLIRKIQSGRNGQRLMYEQSHRSLRSGYLHHRLPVMGC